MFALFIIVALCIIENMSNKVESPLYPSMTDVAEYLNEITYNHI